MTDSPATVSASQVSLILERAAEIDARGDVLAVEELRRIAAEAGIDAAATEMAIQEIMADRETAPGPAVREAEKGTNLPAKKRNVPAPEWVVAGGAVGMAFGFISALPSVVGIPALGATVLYLLFRAVKSMKTGSELSFQLQNFAVLAGDGTRRYSHRRVFYRHQLHRRIHLLDRDLRSRRDDCAVRSPGGRRQGMTCRGSRRARDRMPPTS